MENIPVLNHRLDESNEIVEHVLEMKAKKTPWHLRFSPKAKGLVSFVQNLLSPLTQKEGVRGGQLSAFFQSAASVVVGVGLLVGSTGDVQAACDPPVFDVCFHKSGGSWTSTDGYVGMDIQFKGESGQLYEVVWQGLKRVAVWESGRRRYVFTREDRSDFVSGGGEQTISYDNFYWDHTIPWDWWYGYGCIIHEGYWDWSNPDPDGTPGWVRGNQVASVHFYSYQEAALVYLDNSSSGLPFELSQYYCEIDYEPSFSPKFGYTLGCWEYVGDRDVWPKYNGWRYHGDHGSPRFDYGGSCSYEFWPSPSFGWRCSWDTSTVPSASSGVSD